MNVNWLIKFYKLKLSILCVHFDFDLDFDHYFWLKIDLILMNFN